MKRSTTMNKLIHFYSIAALFMTALLQLFPGTVFAADEEAVSRMNLTASPPALEVYDTKFNYMLTNATTWPQLFNNAAVENYVQFGIDADYAQVNSFSITANLTIAYKKWNVMTDQFDNYSVNKSLTINYDANGQNTITDMATYSFADAHYVKVTVSSFTCNSGTCPAWAQLYLEAGVKVTRNYVYSSAAVTGVSHLPVNASMAASESIDFNWDVQSGAEYYELEYVHINDYTLNPAVFETQANLNYNYYLNSTRVEVWDHHYRIPKVFDHGYVIYRVRGIGLDWSGYRIEGDWSAVESGTVASHPAANVIPITTEHDTQMNWSHSITYAEDGKRAEGVSFSDGMGRTRQAVAYNPVTEQVVVSNSYFDDMGRAVVRDLPTPVNGTTMRHFLNFNLANVSGTPAYGKDYFEDNSSGICDAQPIGFSTTSGTGRYYSASNPDRQGANAGIPDGEFYPFSRVEYQPDLLGRIGSSGAPGPQLTLNSGHEQRYMEVTSNQTELNMLFGTEAGWAGHYQKIVTTDPNGQAYVQYLDMSGRTVASYLMGSTPTQLDALDENIVTPSVTPLVLNGIGDVTDLSVPSSTLSYTQPISETGDYEFEYFFTPSQYTATCGANSICLDCVYDFRLTITDDCGTTYLDTTETINGDSLNAICTGSPDYEMPFTTVHLYGEINGRKVIPYTITKTLTVNQDAIDDYWCYYMDVSCIETVPDIFNELYEDASFCEPVVDVATGQGTECDLYRELMILDMSPGGQYAEYTVTGGVYSFPTESIFNPANSLGAQWNTITYEDENSDPILVENSLGSMVSPATLTAAEFIQLFDESWALSMLEYHPEYCFLQSCDSMVSSSAFDDAMLSIQSFQEAYDLGYFRPMGSGNVPGSYSAAFSVSTPYLTAPDPFFGTHPTQAAQMEALMQNYITVGGVDYSMWDYAILLAMGCEPANYSSCLNEFRLNEENCFEDYVWAKFRELYLREKLTLVTTLHNFLCGADNEDIGVTGPFADKVRRWPNLAELEALNPDDPTPDVTNAADIEAECQEACEDYADEWLAILSECNIDPLILSDVRDDLIDLCMSGCDENTPFPASTNPNGETINDILSNHGITESDLCSELLISEPAPYQEYEDIIGVHTQPLDTCGCDLLLQARLDLEQHLLEFPVDPLYTTVEQMLEATTGIWITEADPLICACNKAAKEGWVPGFDWAWSDNETLDNTGFTIPTALSCEPSACVTCEQADLLYDELATRFGGETALQASPNYAALLTNFFNNELHFHLGFGDYTDFLEQCHADEENPYCTTNPVAEEWLDMMTLLIRRGQLTSSDLALLEENIVFEHSSFSDLLSNGEEAHYWLEQSGAEIILHYGSVGDNCTIVLNNAQGIDLSAITSFNAVFAASNGCADVTAFDLEISYLECGELQTAVLPAMSNCFPVMSCFCGGGDLTLCDELPGAGLTGPPCYETLLNELYTQTFEDYFDQVETAKLTFNEEYNAKCAEAFVTEDLTFSGFTNNYQYTLFYYDQAGNLVKTVAPEGINMLLESQSGDVDDSRLLATDVVPSTPLTPGHDFVTSYAYNSYNQPVTTSNPDQIGATQFWYDRYGRIVASQNPVQAAALTYSYSLYDPQGRIVETGQICRTVPGSGGLPGYTLFPISESTIKADDLGAGFKSWVYSGKRSEVTINTYDEPLSGTIAGNFNNAQQENLRLRIATVAYFESIPTNVGSIPNYYSTLYTSAIHFSYDIHGNVIEKLQDLPELDDVDQDIKSTQYEFELLSGKVKTITYQEGENDFYAQEFVYDLMNRLLEVFVTTDNVHKDRDAHYFYYDYGPLARTELGQNKVQGQDLAYTINGWLKGMNSGTFNPNHDLGRDGKLSYDVANNASHSLFARDVTGYTLGYFEGDYQPIGNSRMVTATASTTFGSAAGNLYNGNIRHTVTAIRDANMKIMGAAYQYDQLHRIKEMTAYYNTDLDNGTATSWQAGTVTQEYHSDYAYDRNGNLTYLNRNGNSTTGLDMDEFVYHYPPNGSDPWNRLNYVTDNGTDYGAYSDVKSGQSANNYTYDALGQLLTDVDEGISNINWRLGDKKARSVTTATEVISFLYDPFGVRIAKIVKPGGTGDKAQWKYSYYVNEANGRTMAVYDVNYGSDDEGDGVTLGEQHLYGLSRLGLIDVQKQIWFNGVVAGDGTGISAHKCGDKRFELVNHLGNVNAVITDRKVLDPDDTNGQNFEFNNPAYPALTTSGCSAPVYSVVNNRMQIVTGACPTTLTYNSSGLTVNQPVTISFDLDRSNIASFDVVISLAATAAGPFTPATGGTFTNVNGEILFTYNPTASTDFYRIELKKLSSETAPFSIDNFRMDRLATQYLAVVKMSSDYYPFGMTMPGRHNVVDDYRYGYTGKEEDPELKGSKNSYDFGNRLYDPRLGRWLSTDPLKHLYSSMSPYCYAGNMPIAAKDPDGNIIIFVNGYIYGPPGITTFGGYAEGPVIPSGRFYWYSGKEMKIPHLPGPIPDSEFIQAAQTYFDDEEVFFVNGTGYDAGSTASDRWEDGYLWMHYNVLNLAQQLAYLGPDEKIEIVSHSMGSAYTEGMIAYLQENAPELASRITTVVHLSAADAEDIEIAANTEFIDRTQLNTEYDHTLKYADFWTRPQYRVIPGIDLFGYMAFNVFLYHPLYVKAKLKRGENPLEYDSHADTKYDPRTFTEWLPALKSAAQQLEAGSKTVTMPSLTYFHRIFIMGNCSYEGDKGSGGKQTFDSSCD